MQPIPLKLEQLEDRSVPAVFGLPWANPSHVTLSFVPDGTDISGVASNLSTLLSGASGSQARQAVLRAFQTWVANANVNIGLVADDGSAFDSPGAVQGDARFGDIRIGGRAWSSDVLALTTPFNYFNTQSGNIALNTAATFSVDGAGSGNDLFTVFLQEAGHSLGLANSADINSVMYEWYQGARTGLAGGDVSAIQGLYGARKADAYEGAFGNNSLFTATSYSGALTADLTTGTDVDYYRFTAAADGSPTVVQLRAAGLSFVLAKVQVVDALGQVVAEGSAADPTQNNITLNLSGLQPGGTYFVRVSGNSPDVFGIGAYGLSIGAPGSPDVVSAPVAMLTSGVSFDSAIILAESVAAVDQQLDYTVQANPADPTAGTYFRLHAPTAAADQSVHLVASVTDLVNMPTFQVQVYDVNHNLLNARVLSNVAGGMVVELDNVAADADYFIRVSAPATFDMTVDFTTKDVPFSMGSIGTATTATTESATLTIRQSQVLYFVLAGDSAGTASVLMTVRDTDGNVVVSLTVQPGEARSTSAFLKAGSYIVEITALSPDDSVVGTIDYHLAAATITDPVGAPVVDPTTTPVGGSQTGSGTAPPPNVNGPTAGWVANSTGGNSVWF